MTSLNELTQAALKKIIGYCYSEDTIKTAEKDFGRIIALHRHYDKNDLDPIITSKYLSALETMFNSTLMSKGRYLVRVRNIERLKLFAQNGEWTHFPLKPRFPISYYYDELLFTYMEQREHISEATKVNTARAIRKHFIWLKDNNYPTLEEVNINAIKIFIEHCVQTLSGSSTLGIRGYLKNAYQYFFENDYSNSNFEGIFSLPIAARKRIHPPIPQREIAETLKQIDRSTVKGKRDYAAIMLGIVTGMRAVDVAKLKLQDIDWEKGEIRIIQSKTQNAVALPLTADVGKAIEDYILHGRPRSSENNVFLRIHPPYKSLRPAAVDTAHAMYRQGAGLKRMGFHSLRRALGKSLVTAGIAVETTAQVFGNRRIESLTLYLSFDTLHLKECALDFSGIMPMGEWI